MTTFQANFESDIRIKYLELLGYNKEELALKVRCIFLLYAPRDIIYTFIKCLSVHLVINVSFCCQISAALEEKPADPPQVSLLRAVTLMVHFKGKVLGNTFIRSLASVR